MPGPGSRAKAAKSKKSTKLADLPVMPIESLSDVHGWTPVVDILCTYFALPDLTTRKGLKKIHARFDPIYAKLDDAYGKHIANERIRGGIIAIYSKMCTDALLRNKLFEKGILDKLTPLLDIEATRHMALQALTTITRHGGIPVRAEVAKRSSHLCRLVDQFPADAIICEQVISILSHSVLVCMDGFEGSPPFPALLKSLDLTKILNTAVHCMTQPFSCSACVEHGASLISNSALHGHYAYKGAPEAVKIMIACMRSPSWQQRCMALGGLTRLHRPGADEDTRQVDPQALMSILGRFPKNVNDAMMAYGPPRCDIYLTLKALNQFMKAINHTFPQDRDLCALGMKLYENILSTEFSIYDGFYEVTDLASGQRMYSTDALGKLPFQRWSDSLVVCAKAIRQRGRPGDADIANVLEIKHTVMRGDPDGGASLGQRALAHNPNFAYYYYAVSLAADPTAGLRAAKQGMKCKEITSFVKFQLMQRAVDHGAELGLQTLQAGPPPGEAKWQVGIALLTSALEDAKRFLWEAPPDNRYLKNVAYWFVLLTILLEEEVSLDLREIQFALERLEIADAVSRLLNTGPPKTMHRRAQETVRKLYKTSIEQYGHLFNRGDEDVHTPDSHILLEDDLSAWLAKLQVDDDGEGGHGYEERHEGHDHAPGEACGSGKGERKTPIRATEMYRCSYCGNPSASLRKCSGCVKARYCDGSCQKKHWADHKKTCKS